MAKSTTCSEQFLRYSLPPYTKIIRPRISFTVNTIKNDNQYDQHFRTCAYVSFMLELVDLTVSYAPVDGIFSPCITISNKSKEVLIILVLDISNDSQNNILTNPEERIYNSLPYLYLKCFEIKCPKHPLATINKNELSNQAIKLIQGKYPMEHFGMKY